VFLRAATGPRRTSATLAGSIEIARRRPARQAASPEAIAFVRDLPKTRNAKVMRRVIRAAYLGDAPGDLTALENPQAVDDIRRSVPATRPPSLTKTVSRTGDSYEGLLDYERPGLRRIV
jgi:hypothetical protein